MKRYRYRTATLVGPWRDSRLKAESDAIALRQAAIDPASGALAWRVPGEIEVGDGPASSWGPRAPAEE